MALGELEPYIHEMNAVVATRRNLPSGTNSETSRLLQTAWFSGKEGKKNRGIGNCLIEEGVEVGIAGALGDREGIINESQKAVYLMVVGWVSFGIPVKLVLDAVQLQIQEEIVVAQEPICRLAQYAGNAVGQVGGAGSAKDRESVIQGSARALVSLNTLWDATGVTPQEVGEAMLTDSCKSS